VLIVEDDIVSASALGTILRRRGFQVVQVTTVADGLARLAGNPQFVILDLMLPDGDGATVLKAIRDQHLKSRVLVTTAVNDPQQLRDVRDLKPEMVIQKPIDLTRLLTAMDPLH
jgi:two-component system response regulator QseB